MTTKREYIVIANEGTNVSEIDKDLSRSTASDRNVDSNIVPDRKCGVVKKKETNDRITHYLLTDEEAKALRNDARILDVHLKPTIGKLLLVDQEENFTRSDDYENTMVNWGLKRHIDAAVDPSAQTNPYNETYGYNLTGEGVDIVIQDDGIEVDHPEFLDSNGISRVKQIDWYAETGITGTMPVHFYETTTNDPNYSGGEHGTHIAAIIAGKTYGWAKEARIYSMRIFGGPSHEIDYTESFDLIRVWHQNKPVDPQTGLRRPTIVNQSWGFAYYYDNQPSSNPSIRNIFYKGVDQGLDGGEARDVNYGMVAPAHPMSVPSVDVEQQQLTDAGVICIHASGNSYHPQASIHAEYNSDIYDSYYTRDDYWAGAVAPGDPIYYNRAMSPNSKETITVGALTSTPVATDEVAYDKSERGPIIDVWAAGDNIISATSTTSTYLSVKNYPDDAGRKIARMSGSSVAAPQVSGVLCLLAQMHPSITPQQCKDFIISKSTAGIVDTGTDEDWSELNTNGSLYGSEDRILYWPHGSGTNTTITGDTDINSTNIT